MRFKYVPFLVIGIAFIVLGMNGQRAFFAIGIAFLVLGFIMAIRSKRVDD